MDTYRDGCVTQMESERWTQTNWQTVSRGQEGPVAGIEQTYPETNLLEFVKDIPERVVMGVELNLAGAVKENVILPQIL